MALFSSKKNTETKVKKVSEKPARKVALVSKEKKAVPVRTLDSSVLLRPRITEKVAMLSEGGRMVCLFEVSPAANKKTVSEAVTALYKVVPEKVAVLKVPAKRAFVRGHMTKGKTTFKAYVYLKKGETIDLV